MGRSKCDSQSLTGQEAMNSEPLESWQPQILQPSWSDGFRMTGLVFGRMHSG